MTGMQVKSYIKYLSVGQVAVDVCTMCTRGVTVQGQITDVGQGQAI